MYKIQTLNKISAKGLELMPREIYETATEVEAPDAVLLRSYKMHNFEMPPTLKAIARAGAGVNNIPVEKCSEKGIVVFNTPGANANSVKELILAGLFLSSRKIFDAMTWVKTLTGKGDEIPKIYEKEKSRFAGPEIKNKKLGVIGLGAIGVMTANAAHSLGMKVVGLDPFISIESAWGLSRAVKRAPNLDMLLAESDYITINVPLNEKTKGMINKAKFSVMKKGVRLLNFARGGLVNNKDLLNAIDNGIVSCYVTDFPDEELLKHDRIISIPHLGASTPEAEDNCAVMAVEQLKDFLENGNIKNSVNFPACEMERFSKTRIIIANKNIPNIISQITTILADNKVNIENMLNRHKDNFAYNIIDTDSDVPENLKEMLNAIEGIVMTGVISG